LKPKAASKAAQHLCVEELSFRCLDHQ